VVKVIAAKPRNGANMRPGAPHLPGSVLAFWQLRGPGVWWWLLIIGCARFACGTLMMAKRVPETVFPVRQFCRSGLRRWQL